MDPIDISGATNVLVLNALLAALVKQPGIDVEKLTKDINTSLLVMEVGSEERWGEMGPKLVRTARAVLKRHLPTLATG